MKDHNIRAEAQWKIMKASLAFDDQSVINIGSGYDDMSRYVTGPGKARHVFSVEGNVDIHLDAKARRILHSPDLPIYHIHADADKFNEKWPGQHDIGICFSVLPYLKDPETLLRWMKEHCVISLLEFQYAGDGPGFEHIKDTADAEKYLRGIKWDKVGKIGETVVKDRGVRDIWRCYD